MINEGQPPKFSSMESSIQKSAESISSASEIIPRELQGYLTDYTNNQLQKFKIAREIREQFGKESRRTPQLDRFKTYFKDRLKDEDIPKNWLPLIADAEKDLRKKIQEQYLNN